MSSENAEDESAEALVTGNELRSLLGFKTDEALRAAVRRGRVAVPVFRIDGRRGLFARMRDVVAWQATLQPIKPQAR